MSNGHFDFIQELREFAALFQEVSEATRHLENEQILKYRDSQDLFVIANQNGMFVMVNTALAECLGYSRYGLLAQAWQSLIHPDDDAELIRAREIDTVRAATEEDHIVLRHRHRAGHYVKIRWLYVARWTERITLARGECLGPEPIVETIG